MKRTWTSLLIVAAALGSADANVEIGGMAGIHLFNQNSELGVMDRPDATSQRNSLLAGVRVGVFAVDMIGIEAEFGVIPTAARETEFGVVDLTYRAHVVALLRAKDPTNRVVPFVLVGAGALTVVRSNNVKFRNDPVHNIESDTDATYYFGGGLKIRASAQWGVRTDFRVMAVPSSENTLPADPNTTKTTVDFEAMVSLYADFGRVSKVSERPAPPPPVDDDPDKDTVHGRADQCPRDPEDNDGYQDDDGCPDVDNDADGIVDGEDRCALAAEDRDGFEDADGCPERDNDRDGLVDNVDACPAEAEDKDDFEDDDGCPDPDNDEDGVADGLDKCGKDVETINGYLDDDGCADNVPDAIAQLTTGSSEINFRVNTADLSPRARRRLDAAVKVLFEASEVRLEIRAHTDGDNNLALSQKRADAVRAYLITKGINVGRLTAKGYGDRSPLVKLDGLSRRQLAAARAKNRRIELRLPGTP